MQCGLLGRKLGHSYSPQIHAMLGSYGYALFEKEPEALEDFLKNGDFTGGNGDYKLYNYILYISRPCQPQWPAER